MKRRRVIAWVLVWVSLIMSAAPVLPHHHHRELLCLQHDLAACSCSCADHHRPAAPGEGHACHAGCVTKFKSVVPDRWEDSVSPRYSFCSLLYTPADVLSLPACFPEGDALHGSHYAEKLHPMRPPQPAGLRAPPAVLA